VYQGRRGRHCRTRSDVDSDRSDSEGNLRISSAFQPGARVEKSIRGKLSHYCVGRYRKVLLPDQQLSTIIVKKRNLGNAEKSCQKGKLKRRLLKVFRGGVPKQIIGCRTGGGTWKTHQATLPFMYLFGSEPGKHERQLYGGAEDKFHNV